MVRKRSCPAVSQICSLTRLPSSSMVLILKSIPMVVIKDGVNESSLNRNRQQDLPTPESPIKRSLICAGGNKAHVSRLPAKQTGDQRYCAQIRQLRPTDKRPVQYSLVQPKTTAGEGPHTRKS